jgi:hypothetical protein
MEVSLLSLEHLLFSIHSASGAASDPWKIDSKSTREPPKDPIERDALQD